MTKIYTFYYPSELSRNRDVHVSIILAVLLRGIVVKMAIPNLS
ncbi:MAG TPA: hypothetical protein VKA98_08740 [Nitrososphaeraceae archaeon]|nr:hypothetical protein [Nitrososphaeraceae archaeon]